MKGIGHQTRRKKPTAVLVALTVAEQTNEKTLAYLAELEFLAKTMEIVTRKTFVQHLPKPDPKTFIRKGKLQKITEYVLAHAVDMIIFDDDLTTAQVKNLTNIIANCAIVDRSLLILQIFMKRAKTAQAKTQVTLAQYQYMLPKLTRLWTHHSRQHGGLGMKGPGETELETDKRIIRKKIGLLKKKLEKIEKQSAVRRQIRHNMVRVALVGYTNVGKSTLMKKLTRADVFAEDKLFATVDATVRKSVLFNVPFLLTDTVGFIRKLPTTLIESFKSTLDEIKEADILVHMVDISHASFEEQITVVNKTLVEINTGVKPTIMVFNKIDQFVNKEYPPFEDNPPATLDEWKQLYMGRDETTTFISAIKGENMWEFKQLLHREIAEVYAKIYA